MLKGEVELMARYPTRATSAAPIPYFFHDGVLEKVLLMEESLSPVRGRVRGSTSTSVNDIIKYYGGAVQRGELSALIIH